MFITDTKDISDYESICLSFNYANEYSSSELKISSNTASISTKETLAITVINPNKITTVKHAIKLTSRISFKSIVASIILTIANLFI